ncbi:hypothetical protein FPCIR_6069 [Fusarium pseudocircinatum]|uniref:Fungal N-terminal domain-containing protein n=1 Tax=Fusarium pseudocircinatum TaxID=56676 RepID=A0A8H5P7G2_9HYPO|nr:hypothetical protein FPCIR_6069 [Fusarium pseudocircinatum]
MEPISLAFEITSLSMQLVGMVKTIKELVTSYRSAAQVLEELCLRLDTIETICDCLGASLSQASSSTQKPELLPLLNSLKRSVQECYGKVSNVSQVIAKVNAKLESTCNPFMSLGVSFLRYRPELTTYVDSLDSSLSLLHGIMAAISFSQESVMSMPVNHSSPRSAHLPPMPEFDATNHSVPPQEISKDLIKRWRHQCSSLVILQKTQKSRIQDLNASNTQSSILTQESSTFTFGSSLLNTYIQLSIMRGSLAPFSVRLRIPRVLLISEDATGVGESVRKAFDSDDLQATQDLFSQGLLNTATAVTYTEYNPEDEASLLGLGKSLQSRKIFNFLKFQMDLSEPRNHAARCFFPYRTPRSDEAFACILEYIHVRQALLTPAEFGILLWISKARQITACVEACRQCFPYNWDRFDDVILTELEDWAPLFTDIVARGQDVLTNPRYHQFTGTVRFILWCAFDPDDAWYHVCRWVDMLELAQVDVTDYLKAATKYCSENWVEAKS